MILKLWNLLVSHGSQRHANPPQRYTSKLQEYRDRNGKIVLEDETYGFVKNSENNACDLARLWMFCLTFDQIEKEALSGDVAEVGVFEGSTAFLLARFARRLGKKLFLLDTFEGFSTEDLVGVDGKQQIQFSDNSLECVRAFVGDENVQFVKGHFPTTTRELPSENLYCLVHIDCDLFAPIKAALDYFYPRLVPGGFLIIHDYASGWWPGAEKAVDEFFANKPEFVILMPDISGSVAVRKVA